MDNHAEKDRAVLCIILMQTETRFCVQKDEAAAWESEKQEDSQRLKRHQRVLDKQSRALLKLPNRKERSEVSNSAFAPFHAVNPLSHALFLTI